MKRLRKKILFLIIQFSTFSTSVHAQVKDGLPDKGIEWISRKDLIKLNSYEGKKARMIESGIFDGTWEGVSKEELMKKAEYNLRSFNNPLELSAN